MIQLDLQCRKERETTEMMGCEVRNVYRERDKVNTLLSERKDGAGPEALLSRR